MHFTICVPMTLRLGGSHFSFACTRLQALIRDFKVIQVNVFKLGFLDESLSYHSLKLFCGFKINFNAFDRNALASLSRSSLRLRVVRTGSEPMQISALQEGWKMLCWLPEVSWASNGQILGRREKAGRDLDRGVLPKGRSTPGPRGFPRNKGGHLVNDLRAALTTPWGVVVELLPRGAGGRPQAVKITDDEAKLPAVSTLRGRNSQGAWKLTVQDLGPADKGHAEQLGPGHRLGHHHRPARWS